MKKYNLPRDKIFKSVKKILGNDLNILYTNKSEFVEIQKGVIFPVLYPDIYNKLISDLKTVYIIYKSDPKQYWIFHGDDYYYAILGYNSYESKDALQDIERFLKKKRFMETEKECFICCEEFTELEFGLYVNKCGKCGLHICNKCIYKIAKDNNNKYVCPTCKMVNGFLKNN